MDCIFCKISNKEIPARIITDTKNSIVFLDAFPLPKSHYEKIQDMPNEVSADLFSTVHKIIPKIDKISGATLLAIHNGKESGQEIPHVHVHLIPRRSDDLAGPVHSMFKNKPKLSDEELDELCAKIKNS